MQINHQSSLRLYRSTTVTQGIALEIPIRRIYKAEQQPSSLAGWDWLLSALHKP